MSYGPYEWPKRSSPLSREFVACVPIIHMSSKQLEAFKVAIDKVHDLEESVGEQVARTNILRMAAN